MILPFKWAIWMQAYGIQSPFVHYKLKLSVQFRLQNIIDLQAHHHNSKTCLRELLPDVNKEDYDHQQAYHCLNRYLDKKIAISIDYQRCKP